jgi:hypothetical protein
VSRRRVVFCRACGPGSPAPPGSRSVVGRDPLSCGRSDPACEESLFMVSRPARLAVRVVLGPRRRTRSRAPCLRPPLGEGSPASSAGTAAISYDLPDTVSQNPSRTGIRRERVTVVRSSISLALRPDRTLSGCTLTPFLVNRVSLSPSLFIGHHRSPHSPLRRTIATHLVLGVDRSFGH